MKYCVGIDLGSTTTKAVVVDEAARVLGRGITNSRSSYDAACQVAVTEALHDARFAQIAGELAHMGVEADRRAAWVRDIERGFREQQYRTQLLTLREELRGAVALREHDAALEQALATIQERMGAESKALFAADANRKSDFFRDLAGSRYLEHAEKLARKKGSGLSFDTLVGLFDKAILEVEARSTEAGAFAEHALHAARELPERSRELERAIEAAAAIPMEEASSVGTGYGRARLPFPKERIRSEILCHGLGAHLMFPRTRTVLDIGGQDTKAIQVDESGIVTSFQMNDRCAAGCGRYLGYIADEMNLGLHELGPMACNSKRAVRINSTCTVFAGAELRERLSLGEQREDILAGLHRAIILRAMSLLSRSGGVKDEFTFTGGVARNPAAVGALKDLVRENYGELTINISSESIYTGALGAALFAWREWNRKEVAA
ncbi:MAG: benzoyl-CoA reductase subunit A [Planctomycetes bacterium]|nr:benzoyl-CoA reductase subunit A [Planctomycetota bacterium]